VFNLGLLTALLHVMHIFAIAAPYTCSWNNERIKGLFVSTGVLAEMNVKTSCSYKLSRMAQNALDIVRVNDKEPVLATHFAQALDEYARSGKKYVQIGGFIDLWKSLKSRKAFEQDGIWISTRWIASNLAQFFVTIYVLLGGISLIKYTSKQYDDGQHNEYWATFTQTVLTTALNQSIVQKFSLQVIQVITEYLNVALNATAIGCSSAAGSYLGEEILASFCTVRSGNYSCDPQAGVNYLCGLPQTTHLDPQTELAFLEASGLNLTFLVDITEENIQGAVDQQVHNLYPAQKFMIMVPVIIGVVVAFLVSVYLAVSYMPSVATTVLQLRSGVIPTLRDEDFDGYRTSPDQVVLLTGGLFWGSFIASLAVGGLAALVVFLFVVTAIYAQKIVAAFIGIILITVLRLLILLCIRSSLFTVFYRTRPARANILMLGLEWASFAVSVGFALLRMAKLLVIACAYIGRIDRPFLAKGVGEIGKSEIDSYPAVHTKDILIQEAHRHPFLELLGAMYMMKLRYADHFGKTAGSCWRLLFIYALFPWLSQYRVNSRRSITHKGGNEPEASGNDPETTSLQHLKYVSLRQIVYKEAGDEASEHLKSALVSLPHSAPTGKRQPLTF